MPIKRFFAPVYMVMFVCPQISAVSQGSFKRLVARNRLVTIPTFQSFKVRPLSRHQVFLLVSEWGHLIKDSRRDKLLEEC